jgi:hypothetical protein
MVIFCINWWCRSAEGGEEVVKQVVLTGGGFGADTGGDLGGLGADTGEETCRTCTN